MQKEKKKVYEKNNPWEKKFLQRIITSKNICTQQALFDWDYLFSIV